MTRVPPDQVSPTGQSVATDCTTDVNGAESWPDATARFSLTQRNGNSTVSIRMRRARANTYYTVWLRLGGTDSNGVAYGRSPLTGIPATPLVESGDLPVMLASTGPANGNASQPNGSWTDERGNASQPNGSWTDERDNASQPNGSWTDERDNASQPNGSWTDERDNASQPNGS